MPARSRRLPDPGKPRRPPKKTPEAREGQMVSYAVDLAEEQLRQGTASAQVIVHYLKLGTGREKLEREQLEKKNELLQAQVDALASAAKVEAMYAEAIAAFRTYAGQPDEADGSYQELLRTEADSRFQRALQLSPA